jgi:hypothetical protein
MPSVARPDFRIPRKLGRLPAFILGELVARIFV